MKKLLILVMILISQVIYADTITVDGSNCTLGDAIEAANTDMTTVGGCVDAATGADTLILDSVFTALVADTIRSTLEYGSYAALPDITTDITIQAGTKNLIERGPSLDCSVADQADEFRLLQVLASGQLTLDGITIRYGCSNSGGAVLVNNGHITTLSTTFLGNKAQLNTDSSLVNSGGAIAVYNLNSTAAFTDSSFFNNSSIGHGNFSAQGGALKVAEANSLLIINTQFLDNSAKDISTSSPAYGGAVYINEVATVQIIGSLFSTNDVFADETVQGGALFLDNSIGDFTLSDSVFVNNEATSLSKGAHGGAIYSRASNALMQNLLFKQNITNNFGVNNSRGGAVFLGALASLNNVHFTENQANQALASSFASAEGGALYINGFLNAATVLENVTFDNNLAQVGDGDSNIDNSARGGAVFGCEITATNLTLSNNHAIGGNSTNGTGGDAQGGGLYSDCSPSVLSHMTVVGNSVVAGNGNTGNGIAQGGGVLIRDDTDIDNSIIQNNFKIIDSVATGEDCFTFGSLFYANSLGYNHIGDAGNCTFAATGDQTVMDASVYSLADYGCETLLPDGTCLPTHAIDLNSSALDQGSCMVSGLTADARGKIRPYDDLNVVNADDGCDVGAFEYDHDLIFKNGFEN